MRAVTHACGLLPAMFAPNLLLVREPSLLMDNISYAVSSSIVAFDIPAILYLAAAITILPQHMGPWRSLVLDDSAARTR